MSKLYNIKNWTRQNLRAWMVENAETQSKMQAFRADQIFYWLYQQKVESFAEMLNISQEIRKMLEEHFWISSMKIVESQKSQDGSIKYRLLLEDGHTIECVFMPHTNHNTVCVSSQVGCGMGCDFCMTGTMGLVRNLKTAEIIDQILTVWGDLPDEQNLRNIVFMGMGEPFHN